MTTPPRMIRDAPNINYLFAGLVVEELVRHGVEWFVISPGSRSAPLAWTVASHPRAKSVVHFDERGAAFHALGIAKATLKPAAFICTSGTAAANALPAAVEASYSGIPLLLLTADRPEYLRGSGANQTINQHGLYREFVRDEKNFAVSAADFDAAAILSAIDDAVYRATDSWPSPVHLNCQFDEPLAPDNAARPQPDWSAVLDGVSAWMAASAPYTRPTNNPREVPADVISAVMDAITSSERGVIVVGQLTSREERQDAQSLIMRLGWPAVTDVTSGLTFGASGTLHCSLHILERVFRDLDTVLQLGGPVTSRRLLDALAQFRAKPGGVHNYIRVSPAPGALDPYRNITQRTVAGVSAFFTAIGRALEKNRTPALDEDLLRRQVAVFDVITSAFPDDQAVSEPAVAFILGKTDRAHDILFLGNSMPIRGVDLYASGSLQPPWIMANRGASGIDGNIATAAGIARAGSHAVTALIGDLAALHDLNSLALLRDLGTPFALVVLNNNGGGIFHFLPIAKHTGHFERIFATPHSLDFEAAARMFGLPYHRPATNGEFRQIRRAALERNGATIIEVQTDREQNVRLHRELDAKIRAALDKP